MAEAYPVVVSRNRRIHIAIVVSAVLALLLFWRARPSRHLNFDDESPAGIHSQRKNPVFVLSGADDVEDQPAGNSTLGFRKILALSQSSTWRSRGLLKAGEYSGLTIDIPQQPTWTSEMIEAFQHLGPTAGGSPRPLRGAARAWLAHLDLVKFVLQSGFETALILEDDADWDVDVRAQTVRVARAVRRFTGSDVGVYGHDRWDILWLGLCAEFFDANLPHLFFADPSVVAAERYAGWAHEHVLQIPSGHRNVQWGIAPVCTFGYAITQRGARKVLDYAGRGQAEAYDIILQRGCAERLLDCITVNPEIFHQYRPRDKGYKSQVGVANAGGKWEEKKEYETEMGWTENIVKSARCAAMWGRTCL